MKCQECIHYGEKCSPCEDFYNTDCSKCWEFKEKVI